MLDQHLNRILYYSCYSIVMGNKYLRSTNCQKYTKNLKSKIPNFFKRRKILKKYLKNGVMLIKMKELYMHIG